MREDRELVFAYPGRESVKTEVKTVVKNNLDEIGRGRNTKAVACYCSGFLWMLTKCILIIMFAGFGVIAIMVGGEARAYRRHPIRLN
jgi:hypothetical protein